MPKISKRRHPHGQNAPRSAPILSQAHKVSFEENSRDESSLKSLQSRQSCSPSLIPRTSPCQNMTRLLAQKPTSLASLSELSDNMSVYTEVALKTAESEDMSSSSCPWGHFVDVIPDDNDDWGVRYESCLSPHHSSPAYHPYRHHQKSARKSCHLPSIPGKSSTTKKLQRRSLKDVEGAMEHLRF